jgi:hypothetical protein
MGLAPQWPPSVEASRMEALRVLWSRAGLEAIETHEITVQRTFADFEDCWAINLLGTVVRPMIAAMTPGDVETLKQRVRARVPADAAGRVTYSARANAIKGRVAA